MDKDSVILKFEQENTSDIENEMQELQSSNDSHEKRLAEMQSKLAKLTGKSGLSKPILRKSKRSPKTVFVARQEDVSYVDLYAEAQQSLFDRGLSFDDYDYNNLVSNAELEEIIAELNSPLPREEKWRKSDFIVTFIAAFVGCTADIILSNKDNKLTGNGSKCSEKLNELHENTFKHKSGAPIDYQGKGFGGGYHRELSKGHDLARFNEGIKMFKEGKFEGVRYIDGVAHKVITTANQYETPFAQLTTIEAIIGYASHMFADLFSKYSLPFPGYSFLTESNSRNIRIFAADMYKNGFNLKNIMTQSVSAIIIEVIVRLFYSIQSVKDYADKVEIDEHYSNIDALKEFINPKNKEKLNEMLLVAHAIVMAENVGKITIKCIVAKDLASVSQLNIAEIIAVVRYGISVVNSVAARNNEYAKLIYHTDETNANWAELEEQINTAELAVITEMPQIVAV